MPKAQVVSVLAVADESYPLSSLALLLVALRETKLMRASSCSRRAKVSDGDLYKESSELESGISFVYPGKKNTRFLASSYFK